MLASRLRQAPLRSRVVRTTPTRAIVNHQRLYTTTPKVENGGEVVSLAQSTLTLQAKSLPNRYNQMPNDVLLSMISSGDQEAREERLIREIMAVDDLEWDEANKVFLKMVESNRRNLWLITFPYKIGIVAAVSAGTLAFPMVFDVNTLLWFNELYVTTQVPDPEDLETVFEAGNWAWNWMEPPLGTISFSLLCFQFARSQMQNHGAKPWTAWCKGRRAERLCREFPRYHPLIVKSFSQGDSFSGNRDANKYK